MTASAFESRAQRHRRELHVHCYRMLGSFEEAEDAVQETLLRAWRGSSQLDSETGFRPWLYRIATNYCLDVLRRRKRRAQTIGSFAEIPWLQPYPDRLLDEIPAAPGHEPDVMAVARETIELAFIAVVQELPPRQRAAVLLCDVMGFSARETAELLETSLAATNSALQRARATLAQRRPAAGAVSVGGTPEAGTRTPPTPRERELVQALISIHEGADAARAAELLAEDVRVTMPPNPWLYEGREAVLTLFEFGTGDNGPGQWKLVPTAANRQPATASYLRDWDDTVFRAFKLDVFDIRDGLVAQITTFGSDLFEAFGLPPTWEGERD
ncbi:MAG TPA: RNA polymerase subunit sigma-70 [Solirubrobacteraceae bacterium]|jgi:RNA polymerase sigma-70 factor (ECF subfamily)|nr:RNA polymerase subunit sigma-70 [Solirubrobacteraceae bacterium]